MTETNGRLSSRTLQLVAAAIGGSSALLHLANYVIYQRPFEDGRLFTSPMAVGEALLYAAPLFLGILAGIHRPEAPTKTALGLVGLMLLVAAPLMFQDFVCLIFIVPVNVVVAPIAAKIASKGQHARFVSPEARGVVNFLLLLIPFTGAIADSVAPPAIGTPVELVDSTVIDMSRDDVWRSLDGLHLRFEREPSWIVRMLLPVPQELVSGGNEVGAERRVIFSNGVAIGRVTHSVPGERFTFSLSTEAHGEGFIDHSVRLDESEIVLESIDAEHTRITHRTTYTPLAMPRWYFEPGERWLGKQLQAYMLEAYSDVVATSELLASR